MASLASNQSKAALLDDPTAALWSAWFHPVVTRFRRMFVLVSPAETSFGTVEEVPDYVAEVSRRQYSENKAQTNALLNTFWETLYLTLHRKWT